MLLHGVDQSAHIAMASVVPYSRVSCVKSFDESKPYAVAWRSLL